MSDTHQKQVAVLGSLLEVADVNAKRVISSYDPTVTYASNKTSLKKCNATQLEACATLLGFTVRNDAQEKLYRNQDILADRIVLKIESLFESQCSDCSQSYQNTLEDTPLLSCVLCMQGSHNCESIKDKIGDIDQVKPVGTAWLCFGCLAKNNLDLQAPQNIRIKPRIHPTATSSSRGTADAILPAIAEDDNVDEEDVEERESPRRGRESTSSERTAPSEICEQYKRRNCPHGRLGKTLVDGRQCEKAHPPRCFKYTRYGQRNPRGCNKGTNCQYWHPRLCNESVRTKKCSRENCSFFHLKGTVRSSANQDIADPLSVPARRDSQPPPPANIGHIPRFSIASAADVTPYPPTVQGRSKQGQQRRTDDSSFLLQKIENMKQGFHDQITDLVRNDIPRMLRDLLRETLQTQDPPPIRPPNPQPPQPILPTAQQPSIPATYQHQMLQMPQMSQWYNQNFPPLY